MMFLTWLFTVLTLALNAYRRLCDEFHEHVSFLYIHVRCVLLHGIFSLDPQYVFSSPVFLTCAFGVVVIVGDRVL